MALIHFWRSTIGADDWLLGTESRARDLSLKNITNCCSSESIGSQIELSKYLKPLRLVPVVASARRPKNENTPLSSTAQMSRQPKKRPFFSNGPSKRITFFVLRLAIWALIGWTSRSSCLSWTLGASVAANCPLLFLILESIPFLSRKTATSFWFL